MANIDAAKKLLKQYKEITLSQLEHEFTSGDSGNEVMQNLTGFGCIFTCQLCAEAMDISGSDNPYSFCNFCVYRDTPKGNFHCVDNTYKAMSDATNAKSLYTALQNRIKHLEKAIINYERDNRLI